MELTQLHYFRTVARYEHITQAAEELSISQPALSRTISRLESSLGKQLFTRNGNKISLNENGRIFLRRAEMALLEIEEGLKEVKASDEQETGTISFAITESGFISGPLVNFLISNPKLHVKQYIRSIPEMKTGLESGEFDFAISFSPIESDLIEWMPLVSEEILAFISFQNVLAGRHTVSLRDLQNERFIFNSSSYNIKDTICSYCRRLGFEPDIFYEGMENEVSDKLVESDLGVLFVPSTAYIFHFREFPPQEILATPLHIIEPVGQRVMGISMLKRKHITESSRSFYEYLINYFRNAGTGSA